MISVIMPAHNEAAVIGAALDRFAAQTTRRTFEVVVVPNGCSDDTAAIARSRSEAFTARGVRLHVEERAEPGKIGALNAGDARARFGRRLYCDSDLLVSDGLIDASLRALDTPTPRFVSFDLKVRPPRSAVTRAYARMWAQLPLLKDRAHGIALYAVNEAGRARWGAYPQIVADDHFARLNFAPHERVRSHEASYEFAMPEGLSELLAVRTRWARGNEELAAKFPHLLANEDGGNRYEGFGAVALRDPVGFAVFAGVYAVGKVQGVRKAKLGNASWERAATSRQLKS
ncbi:glycosyltransferase family 2 protein [Parvularcula dongshanensis]|uniref:Glycosyltransferase involved in cell wall biosynthesis n=1 Tax=Parvularcula dongshanensis TaxID=1173995 RepID=A0A840HYX6_9PROT|nr:glycosyltransferase [Parvularcula dongshanensis]MBB4658046.1 glycosyltransferase involved in cell wall biosynthesis [Parvularcula dongshanensis]